MKKSVLIFSILFFLISCSDNKKGNQNANSPTIPEVQIGNQVWTSRNLDVATFRNGDSIPQVRSNEEWERAGKEKKPAWCYYANDKNNGEKYGRMYNWYAVNDPRGLCPKGWHIPTSDEWIKLENFIGIPVVGLQIKNNTGWNSNGNGNNKSGFSAMPGGYRSRDGNFTGIGEFTYLSGITQDKLPDAKEIDNYFIWGRGLHFENNTMMRCGLDKEFGLYVRCIKD